MVGEGAGGGEKVLQLLFVDQPLADPVVDRQAEHLTDGCAVEQNPTLERLLTYKQQQRKPWCAPPQTQRGLDREQMFLLLRVPSLRALLIQDGVPGLPPIEHRDRWQGVPEGGCAGVYD